MSDTLYRVSVRLPSEAADILELEEFSYPVSVERRRNEAFVSAYSSSSFEEAEDWIDKILELLELNADFIDLDRKQIRRLGLEKTELKPNDYLLKYREFFKPFVVKERLLVIPDQQASLEDMPLDIPAVIIDSYLAFGTGVHPTTRMCLEYIADFELSGKTVVDAGTGSGILAIASAILGAEKVIAFDNDKVAIATAKRNVDLNGVSDKVELIEADLKILKRIEADIVLANLTSEVLHKDHRMFYDCRAERIAISGFLNSEEAELRKKFALRFMAGRRLEQSGWVLLEFLNG